MSESQRPLAGYEENFNTLLRAADADDLVLVACTDAATGKMVATVCALSRSTTDEITLVPLAKLFDGDPYEELAPPSVPVPES